MKQNKPHKKLSTIKRQVKLVAIVAKIQQNIKLVEKLTPAVSLTVIPRNNASGPISFCDSPKEA